jgi:CysZ protein
MIIECARLAVQDLFAPEMRRLLWKVLGITLVVLVAVWLALHAALVAFAMPLLDDLFPGLPEWIDWAALALAALAGFGIAFGLAFLLAPVTALVAGLFLDDVAEVVERRDYPAEVAGRAMPLGAAMIGSIKFLGVLIVGNLVALLLLLVPGVNLVAFFLVNGYLLGREFFEFAAMRFRSPQEAGEFRRKHASTVFLAGLLIAAVLAIPVVNLVTPLFAAALMVHLHKRLSRRDPSFADNLRR